MGPSWAKLGPSWVPVGRRRYNVKCIVYFHLILTKTTLNYLKREWLLPTSGQVPPTFGSSNWPNRDRHMAYQSRNINTYFISFAQFVWLCFIMKHVISLPTNIHQRQHIIEDYLYVLSTDDCSETKGNLSNQSKFHTTYMYTYYHKH